MIHATVANPNSSGEIREMPVCGWVRCSYADCVLLAIGFDAEDGLRTSDNRKHTSSGETS